MDPVTFRLVVQRLNQMRHRVPRSLSVCPPSPPCDVTARFGHGGTTVTFRCSFFHLDVPSQFFTEESKRRPLASLRKPHILKIFSTQRESSVLGMMEIFSRKFSLVSYSE
jgi:hypothetical protein